MKKRNFYYDCLPLVSICGLTILSGWGKKEETKKPNIILIMADDMGYSALGCYGQELIQTPNIDKMASQGIRFTDFYSANTVSVPSRVGLLTGRHPGHAPIRDNFRPHLENYSGYMEGYPKELWPTNLPTIGQVMKNAGYFTAQFGKLEAGIPLAEGKMTEHGWNYWFGFKGTGQAFQYYPLELWKNDNKIEYPITDHMLTETGPIWKSFTQLV